tara:strand:- start:2155 stop:2472 length:318 start_codon:yes stop_codon:yes gene_type:complete
MIENFVVSFKSSKYNPNLTSIILAVILSILIIFPILGFTSNGIFGMIILFIIFFIILNSITSENLSNELPSYLYPSTPHTGLDGISLNNYIAGNEGNLLSMDLKN